MKKLVLLLGIISFSTTMSFGYFEEGKTTTIDNFRKQGYSESALKIIDTVNYYSNGQDSKYVRYYQPKRHIGFGKPYTYLKRYFDPIQDDGLFAEHQAHYGNTWRAMEGNPKYIDAKTPKKYVENL